MSTEKSLLSAPGCVFKSPSRASVQYLCEESWQRELGQVRDREEAPGRKGGYKFLYYKLYIL